MVSPLIGGKATSVSLNSTVALPPISGETTSDYNRIYLSAYSSMVEFQSVPAAGAAGELTEPGVLHGNLDGAQTFDPATDLYVLTSDGGGKVTDSNGYDVWVSRTDILTDVTSMEEVVLGAVDLRNAAADDVELDILRGSSTATCSIVFRVAI